MEATILPGVAGGAARAEIRVGVLVPYPLGTVPSQRFRIEQWAPYLSEAGIRIDLFPFATPGLMHLLYRPGRWPTKMAVISLAVAHRLREVFSLRSYDAILIHRAACVAGPPLAERIAAAFGRPVLYDFDDAIYRLHTSQANQRLGWLKLPGKTATLCGLSAHVIVGNAHLAEYARRYNSNVTVIPTSIDVEQYQPVVRRVPNARLVIGWTGSSTSQTHFEMFAPFFRQLLSRRSVEIRVISDRRPEIAEIPVTWRPWSSEREVADLSEFDIGVMPMPDDEWARGKCALKALQYMALGIPTVCSSVGTNREVIEHGSNGLLASTQEEWLTHLEALIDDPRLRRRLGQGGRRTVEERYSMRRCAAALGEVIRQTLASSPRRTRGTGA